MKGSVTGNYRVTFKKKGKMLDARIYCGKMLDPVDDYNGNHFLYASGAHGTHDYLFDNVFLGRSEPSGFLSHQFAETEGGMKVYTFLGRSNDWLSSLNLKCSLPGKIPFKLFTDFSTFAADGRRPIYPGNPDLPNRMLCDAGIYIPLIKDYIEVYCPILVSKDIKSLFYLNNPDLKAPTSDQNDPDKFKRMLRMIRFTFNIHKLNPFERVRNISI